jgi:hypothetical protein
MEPIIFEDRNVRPTEKLIFSQIKDNSKHWQRLFESIHAKYPEVTEEWNFYNDGKRWLMKTMRKKKNLFWTGVHPDTFRITFYFTDKAEPLIEKIGLPEPLLDTFRNGKYYGRIRALSIKVLTGEDVDHVLKLVDIRVKV